MYDDILVPTDGSRGTEDAVRHALDIAEKYNAEIHVLYVVDSSTSYLGEGLALDMIREAQQLGEISTERIVKEAREKGIKANKEIATGNPAGEILERSKDMDLIVMGTHGRHGIGRVLLGSVAERVVRRSEIPVLTVRLTSTGIKDANEAKEVARRALLEEEHKDFELGDPYRESGTWVVPVESEDNRYNVHVDVETRDARVAKVGR